MSKMNVLVVGLALLMQTTTAQTITRNDMLPALGERYLVHPAKNPYFFSPGSPGNPQTWDLSNFVKDFFYNDMTYEVVPLNTAFGVAQFDSPSYCFRWAYAFDPAVINYSYFKVTKSSIANLGYANGMQMAKYTNPDTALSFPLPYAASVSDSFAYTEHQGNDTLLFTGLRTVTFDGYGTLVLPAKTHEQVFRLKSVTTYKALNSQNTARITAYTWHKTGIHYPLAEYYLYSDSSTQLVTAYMSEVTRMPSTVREVEPFRASLNPNPVKDFATLSQLNAGQTEVILTDVAGRIYRREHTSEQELKMDMRNLAPGLYLLQIVSEDGRSTVLRLVKE